MKTIVLLLSMTILFLSGVLLGINQANKGIENTQGYSAGGLEEVIQTSSNEQGKERVEILGEDFETVEMEERRTEYEEIQASHFTQKIAVGLESGIKWVYNQLIQTVYQLIQVFF
ncbi:DUF3679 domain-containing protein [Sediminibacillus massiliensis]|uniref:DUF3679 domain-containing protein n=1 Tax=Sediminibacillus massiliensis TaxID=1926277 RepID=UPI0015C30314|nr:DUF3679 domain-containing protein [Sediminibacillus massiliensis]